MAPTDLSGHLARAYLAMWSTTLVAASGGVIASSVVRDRLPLRLTPHRLDSGAAATLDLAGHNLLVASLPLWLIAAGAAQTSRRGLAHAAVVLTFGINAVLVGLAIGAYGGRLLPYITQLPVEWGVLACTGANWAAARRVRDTHVSPALLAGAALLALAAATIELRLTPHR